jgi:hypothetical protein
MEEKSIDEALAEATDAFVAATDELMILGEDATGREIEKRFRRITDKRAQRNKLVEQWLQIRKNEGLKIDPATAVVISDYVNLVDPYGIYPDLLEEEKCIGRVQFARRPEGDVWVSFYDLPEVTCDAIRNRLRDTPPEDDDLPW